VVVGLGSPYFQSREGGGGLQNVTTQLEAATYLHCRVNRLGGKTVSTAGVSCCIGSIFGGNFQFKYKMYPKTYLFQAYIYSRL
jgi:hypothetical protein